MKVMSIEISTCRECPNYTNSSQLHDCAFTSAPYPLVEYCEFGSRRVLLHETAQSVADNCPLDDAVRPAPCARHCEATAFQIEIRNLRRQGYELLGVITDVEHGGGFDDVCLGTLKRVAGALLDGVQR